VSEENWLFGGVILIAAVVIAGVMFVENYDANDYATGETVLDSGVVVDKEHLREHSLQ